MANLSDLKFDGSNLGRQGPEGFSGPSGLIGPIGSGIGPFEVSTITSPHILSTNEIGKLVKINAGGSTVGLNTITIRASTFSLGDTFLIFNETSPSQTIACGAGVTFYSTSIGTTNTTGSIIQQNGLCTVLCLNPREFILSGNFIELPQPSQHSYVSLTYTTSANLTITGNGTESVNIFKTSGSSSWDNQAYSTTSFTAPCTIEFNKEAGATDNGVSYAMIGWNEDPTANASYTTLDYAAYPYSTNAYSVYHNSTQVHSTGSWSTTQKFYIVYGTDGTIKHYNGSTLLYSVNYGTGKTVYVDSSYYSVNATYGGFSNVKVSNYAWNGTSYD